MHVLRLRRADDAACGARRSRCRSRRDAGRARGPGTSGRTPRRCGGTAARSTPFHRTCPVASGASPATARRSVLLPLPLGPSTLTISRSLHRRGRPVERGDRAVANREWFDLEHQNSPTDPTRKRSMARIASAVIAIRITLAAIAAPKFSGPGLSEEPEDEHRHRRRRRPHDEERGAELAERDREGEAGRHQRRRGRRSAGRPHATPERAARRASLPPRASAGRWRGARASSRGSTNGIAIKACAIGTSTQRRAQIERRLVERDEEAESDGHRRHAEREGHERVEARAAPSRERDGAAATDDDREHGREHGVPQRCADRVDAATRTGCCPRCSSSSAVEVEPVSGWGVQRALDEDGDRAAEEDRHDREVCARR